MSFSTPGFEVAGSIVSCGRPLGLEVSFGNPFRRAGVKGVAQMETETMPILGHTGCARGNGGTGAQTSGFVKTSEGFKVFSPWYSIGVSTVRMQGRFFYNL